MKQLLSLAVLMVITISVTKAGQQTTTSSEEYSAGCYFYTLGDTVNAVKCFQKAAKAGSNSGRYFYGLCMIDGIGGVKPNKKAGLKMIRKAAENGEPDALYFLGTLYETGEYGYSVNEAEALRLYQEASKMGSFESLIACGNTYFSKADTATAIDFWKRAVEEAPIFPTDEQRAALGQITYNLGVFYQYGYGNVQDLYEASVYYHGSVQYGNTKDAAFQLGLISLDNEDDPNQCLATYYFTQAAETGNLEAYVYLGAIERLNGNDEQAFIYYLAAANGGSANGMYCVASLYYDNGDYNSTLYWASQCTDNALAEYLLGLAYYCLEDYEKAKFYLQRCVYKYHLDDAITMLKQLESDETLNRDGLVEL